MVIKFSNPAFSYEEKNSRIPRQLEEEEEEVLERWVKINVGVDCDIIEFHGERAQQYIFTLFNIVSNQK